MRSPCVFCHQPATLTGEHIWSDWIGNLLKVRKYRFHKDDEHGRPVEEWTGPRLNWKIKIVCKACNSGWMSDLENDHAKPVLTGMIEQRPVSLLPLGRASLAAFTFKTMVVADFIKLTQNKPFFSPRARDDFRAALQIPDGIQMWLSSLPSDTADGLLKASAFNINESAYRGFQALIITYGVLPLVIHAVAFRWNKPSRRRLPFPRIGSEIVRDDIDMHQFGVPFWPLNSRIVTWPRRHLTHELLQTLAYPSSLRGLRKAPPA